MERKSGSQSAFFNFRVLTVLLAGIFLALFATGNPLEEINLLKQKKGKDMILYGSATLLSTIIRCNLADEYQLWIHPVILGRGNLLFKNFNNRMNLKLKDSFIFESGVVANSYDPIS